MMRFGYTRMVQVRRMEADPYNCGDVIKILDNDSQIILMHNNYVSFKTVLAFYSQLSYPLSASIYPKAKAYC